MKNLFTNHFFYAALLVSVIFGFIISSYVFGWNPPTQSPPYGNVSACHLTHFDATPPAETCPNGYYTWDALAASSTGYMMCCRVDNPL